MTARTITVAEFHGLLEAQRLPPEELVFRCPICGTLQCALDLIAAGAGADFQAVEKYVGFSCVGRWTNAGPHRKGAPAGQGCDWTLGGLFHLHALEILTPDDKHHPHFDPVGYDEAHAHVEAKHFERHCTHPVGS